ncbi:hypothetical protein F7725_000279, partial [Dissostichus mawsoni]
MHLLNYTMQRNPRSDNIASEQNHTSSHKLEALGCHEQLDPKDSQDSEDPGEYCYGGYHPVHIGDTFNRRYQVVSKLGWGYFSTVWLCQDLRLGRSVAVKVLKSGAGFTQAGQDELALLRCATGPTSRRPSSQRIVRLLDEFKLAGVNGVHMCLVLELLGPDLRSWQLCFGNPGLAQRSVKQILTQILQGLEHLHTQCKIIHTDIKPENILLCMEEQSHKAPTGESSSASVLNGKEAKSTGTFFLLLQMLEIYKHFCEEIQTRQYRSLEVLLGSEYGPSADIWSVACMVSEKHCMMFTLHSLFEPKAGESISLEEDHIAQIMELLGQIPPVVALSGKYSAEYFSPRGNLRRVGPLKLWRLYDVLVEKYNFLLEDATGFSNFLLRMLDFHPERRATAAQSLQHPWLT